MFGFTAMIAPAVSSLVRAASSPAATRLYTRIGFRTAQYAYASWTLQASAEVFADISDQHTAEKLHFDRDPQDFQISELPIHLTNSRLKRNLGISVRAVPHVVVQHAKIIVIPVRWSSVNVSNRQYRKAKRILINNPELVDDPSLANRRVLARYKRANYRGSINRLRAERIRRWENKDRRTPGKVYLDLELEKLKQKASSVEANSVKAIYTKLFHDFVDGNLEIDLTRPEQAGAFFFITAAKDLKGTELEVVRDSVLRDWLTNQRGPITDEKWEGILRGWDAEALKHSGSSPVSPDDLTTTS